MELLWKLFTNFYDVIRKREANRELPDTAIAKLLREDEKLLKTVHNRLGFVLHAGAESSEGAQTKLNREEAEPLYLEAIAICRRVLGENNPNTRAIVDNYATMQAQRSP